MTDIAERPTRTRQSSPAKGSPSKSTDAKLTAPSKLTTRQLASLRGLLEGDRARTGMLIDTVTDEMGAFVSARRDTATDDEHDPEGPTLAFERSQTSAILSQSKQHLAEIAAALTRMDEGRYGLCKTCGNEIALGRLQVRPQAPLCISCAERVR
ncbi:MAG: DnaK suppressor protein [Actinomycetota bacterium]|jgi:RNA polymerase-binding transcription factor DksA|nr:DnaK suppressor protein [Actinomycetota bacterium]